MSQKFNTQEVPKETRGTSLSEWRAAESAAASRGHSASPTPVLDLFWVLLGLGLLEPGSSLTLSDWHVWRHVMVEAENRYDLFAGMLRKISGGESGARKLG